MKDIHAPSEMGTVKVSPDGLPHEWFKFIDEHLVGTGIEREAEYVEIARRRIEHHAAQTRLPV